jgi:hypothetical protein
MWPPVRQTLAAHEAALAALNAAAVPADAFDAACRRGSIEFHEDWIRAHKELAKAA